MTARHVLSDGQFPNEGSLIRGSSFGDIVNAHPSRPDGDRLADAGKHSGGGSEPDALRPWGKKNPYSDDYEG